MKNNKKFKGKYIWMSLIVLTVLLIIVPLIVHILFEIKAKTEFFEANWSAGDMLNFCGTTLSGVGTIFLSILALYQNACFQKINNRLTRLQNVPYYSNVNLFVETY